MVQERNSRCERTLSACSNSADFPVLSTFTLAPKTLILSVSIVRVKVSRDQNVLTFSIRFGEFTAIVSYLLAPVLILRGVGVPEHQRTMTNAHFLLSPLLSANLGFSIVKFLDT